MHYLINTKGDFINAIGYESMFHISENTIAVAKNGKWGFINKQGEIFIPLTYDQAWPFSDQRAFVQMGSRC